MGDQALSLSKKIDDDIDNTKKNLETAGKQEQTGNLTANLNIRINEFYMVKDSIERITDLQKELKQFQ